MAAPVPLHADRGNGRTYTAADRRRSGQTSTNGGLTNGHLKLHPDLHLIDGRDRMNPGSSPSGRTKNRGDRQTSPKLTFNPDHLLGAGHSTTTSKPATVPDPNDGTIATRVEYAGETTVARNTSSEYPIFIQPRQPSHRRQMAKMGHQHRFKRSSAEWLKRADSSYLGAAFRSPCRLIQVPSRPL